MNRRRFPADYIAVKREYLTGDPVTSEMEPEYLMVQPGDTVKFIAADPGHNAATIAGMIPGDGRKFVGKINEEIEVILTDAGIWGIKCSPHYTMGMVMLIQVGDTPANEADLPDNLPDAARQRMLDILERRDAES
ncbi:pseudoazurin [Paracoccus methylovorus]|uniref:Pseudoazurin n=3 Tax=Paracoccaceae TaxID=31989 RepID=A0ABX7JP41_9RHOB|nr:pseudoazurin [Paracoccus methylovorus]